MVDKKANKEECTNELGEGKDLEGTFDTLKIKLEEDVNEVIALEEEIKAMDDLDKSMPKAPQSIKMKVEAKEPIPVTLLSGKYFSLL